MKTSLWERGLARLGWLRKAEAEALATLAARGAVRYEASRDSIGGPGLRGGTELTHFSNLRFLADACDAVRICVDECKAQVLGTPWSIVPSDKAADTGQEEREVEQGLEFFETTGGLGGPGQSYTEFVEELLEDLLVCGCAALYRRPTKGGDVYSIEIVDAATIKPLLSPEGWAPQDNEVAFEQHVGGRKVGEFTAAQMYYLRLSPRSNSRWGRSPTEKVLSAIYQYLGWDDLALSWLRDGDAEHTLYFTPQDWTQRRNLEFSEYLDSLNETLAKRQSKAAVIPDGVRRESGRPRAEGVGETEQVHCLKRIAKAFALNASVLGFAGETYKVSQGEQLRLAELSAKLPRLRMLETLFTDILHEDRGLTTVQFQFDILPYDRLLMANMLKQAGPERVTLNEGRELLGEPPAEGPYADALWTSTPSGEPYILGYPKGLMPQDTGEPEVTELEEPPTEEAAEEPPALEKAKPDLRRWQRQALKFQREGHLEKALAFQSDMIPPVVCEEIAGALSKAQTAEEVRAAFAPPSELDLVAGAVTQRLLGAIREERGRREGW